MQSGLDFNPVYLMGERVLQVINEPPLRHRPAFARFNASSRALTPDLIAQRYQQWQIRVLEKKVGE